STNNRHRGPSMPPVEKGEKEIRTCQQRVTQRDTETHSDSEHRIKEHKTQGFNKEKLGESLAGIHKSERKNRWNLIRHNFYFMCRAAQSNDRVLVYVYILPAPKRKWERNLKKIALFHQPTQHSSHFMRHPACSSNPPFVHSVGRTAAGPAPRANKNKSKQEEETLRSLQCAATKHYVKKKQQYLLLQLNRKEHCKVKRNPRAMRHVISVRSR
ncbi:hypothetical protein MOQ_005466, partial [Trypanosoma cruzi marinkellei]